MPDFDKISVNEYLNFLNNFDAIKIKIIEYNILKTVLPNELKNPNKIAFQDYKWLKDNLKLLQKIKDYEPKKLLVDIHNYTINQFENAKYLTTKTFTGHNSWVYSVSFSPDGKYLASGSGIIP